MAADPPRTRAERVSSLLASSPVLASIKDDVGLERMLASKCRTGILLYGSINDLDEKLKAMRERRKFPLVDIDLIDGLTADGAVVEFLKRKLGAPGVLSNRAGVVKAATQQGLLSVHRHFMIDSMAFHSLERQVKVSMPDAVQVLPGSIPKVIGWLREALSVPLIAGGLIHDEEDVRNALAAGAAAIATSNVDLWDHQPRGAV